jgi:signal transduction histidine kinase/ABC-type amino acid transport substrate-binding protein/PAS domain-containing protein
MKLYARKALRICFVLSTILYLLPIYIGADKAIAQTHSKILIQGDWAFPPYEYLNEQGQPDGFNVELTRAVMKELGYSYEIKLCDWNSVMKSLREGKADLVMGMMYSNRRARIFRFGPIHGYVYQDVVYRKDGIPIRTFDQLKDKRIAVEKNAISHELLHNAGYDSHAVPFKSMNEGLLKLSEGSFDAAMCDREMALEFIKRHKLYNLEVRDLGLPPQEYRYVGNNDSLLANVNKALYKLKQNGTYDTIYKRWFVRNHVSHLSHIVYIILGILLLMAIVLYTFNALLRKKVKKAEEMLGNQNKRLALAIHAGGIDVWGFNVKSQRFYNVESKIFPSEGKPFNEELELIHPDDREKFQLTFQDLMKGIIPSNAICIRIDRQQTRDWQYINKEFAVIKSANGEVETIIGTNKEVTEEKKLQKMLGSSIRKMELAIKCSNLVFWEFDLNNRLFTLHNNPISTYSDKLKVPIDVMISQFHPDDIESVRESIDKALEKQDKVIVFEARLHNPTKGWSYCTFTGTPFERDEKTGLYSKYVGFTRDNTEIIKLNEEIQEFAKKMNYVLRSSNVQTWNYNIKEQEIVVMSGFNENDIKITPETYINQYVDESEREKVKELFQQLNKGELETFSTQRKVLATASKNTPSYVVNDGIPLKDEKGKIIGYFGMCRDITSLIEIQNRLEEEKEKAQQADKLKSTFLANMSHEIRTPLNAIVGFSNLLQDVDDPQERINCTNLINTNSELLLRLINDILDLSKIESGIIEFHREDFDLSQLFDEFASTLRQREKNPNVKFISENPYQSCTVHTDRNRVAQILTNFTTNAIKYTPSGSIKIGYNYVNDGIRIYVEDTGIGIAKEKQSRIFQRFEKLDNFAQGTGLGLSICKAICDASNADIGFDSTEGKGSTFWVWIPCHPTNMIPRND